MGELRCPHPCTCRAYDFDHLVVDCAKKLLDRVPRDIPSNASVLLLNHNRIGTLNNEDFSSLHQLRSLDLSYNKINSTDTDIFSGLGSLQALNLSFNPLPLLNDGFFSKLSQLAELNMTSTRVTFNQAAFVNLTNLRVLVFRQNRLFRFPRFLHQNETLLRQLRVLDFSRNSLEAIHHEGLESLEVLVLSDNKISQLYHRTLRGFKNLTNLTLSQNALFTVDETAFCSDSLRQLDLSFTRFQLTRRTGNVFNCIPNLEDLSLVRCRITAVSHSFKNAKKLRKLNLASTGISDENIYFLLHDIRSLEWLSLQDNSVTVLKRSMFETFAGKLKVLALGSNRITTVNITSLPEASWKRLDKIDLSDNPFTCDCDLSWFLHWTATTNVTISKWWKDPKQYQCSAPARLKKMSLAKAKRFLTQGECFVAPTDWVLLFLFLLLLVVYSSSTVVSIAYRFRWYVKYWYFKYKVQERQNQRSIESQTAYRFDAFVSYSKHDSRWVADELRRHLEEQEDGGGGGGGFRLCIHDRDFCVGEDITHNVLECIDGSRKVLVIASNAFAMSQWCHFELIMAQTRILHSDRDNLVLVLLEEIHEANLPPRLKLQMEKQTYIEWTDCAVGQQLFWERLRLALDKAPPSVVDAELPIEMFQSI